MSHIPDMLYAQDSLPAIRERQRLFDAADRADGKRRAIEEADERTRKAQHEIKKLASLLSEREACALISSVTAAICASPFKHADHASEAVEYLTDAHAVLERVAERCE